MPRTRSSDSIPTNVVASVHGVYSFTGVVKKRSITGKWVDIELDKPFENQTLIRLWGICCGYILPLFVDEGVAVKFKANVNPGTGAYPNKKMNFRLIWETDFAVNGKKFKKISISIKD